MSLLVQLAVGAGAVLGWCAIGKATLRFFAGWDDDFGLAELEGFEVVLLVLAWPLLLVVAGCVHYGGRLGERWRKDVER